MTGKRIGGFTWLLCAATLAVLVQSQPVKACAVLVPIPERISRIYAKGPPVAIVVRVEQTRLGASVGRFPGPWEATAAAHAALRGTTRVTSFDLGDSGNPLACSLMIPQPQVGDLWVVYLGADDMMLGAFPATEAAQSDSVVATFLRGER